MNKTAGIVLGTGGTIGLALLINHLVKTGVTAGKLDIMLEDFSFTTKKGVSGLGIGVPNINFHAKLKINNPTSNDLTISQPYLKVFYQDDTNPIGESTASSTTYTIKAKQATSIDVYVEFSAAKVLPKMPDLLKYMLKRALGSPSTRNVDIEMLVTGNGITQTQKQTVAI